MKEIVIATNNQNKVREIKNKLAPFGITAMSQSEAGVNIDVDETGMTIKENSTLKAEAVYNILHKPVIADDGGLYVDYLNGAPGIHSHRFAGENATDEDRRNKILEGLEGVPDEKRTARFKCCICYIDENGEKHYFEGVAEGTIGYKAQGSDGFGFDPIFHYEGGERSFAEFTPEEKNAVSHWGRAVAKFIDYISEEQKWT